MRQWCAGRYERSDDNFGLNNPNAVVMVKYTSGRGVIV